MGGEQRLVIARPPSGSDEPLLAVRYKWDNRLLVGLPSWDPLWQIVTAFDGPGEGAASRLIADSGWMLSAEGLAFCLRATKCLSGILEVLQGQTVQGPIPTWKAFLCLAPIVGAPSCGLGSWRSSLSSGSGLRQHPDCPGRGSHVGCGARDLGSSCRRHPARDAADCAAHRDGSMDGPWRFEPEGSGEPQGRDRGAGAGLQPDGG